MSLLKAQIYSWCSRRFIPSLLFRTSSGLPGQAGNLACKPTLRNGRESGGRSRATGPVVTQRWLNGDWQGRSIEPNHLYQMWQQEKRICSKSGGTTGERCDTRRKRQKIHSFLSPMVAEVTLSFPSSLFSVAAWKLQKK